MLIDVTPVVSAPPLELISYRKATSVSMFSRRTGQMLVMVRPPDSNPGREVETSCDVPSLQALTLSESMASLNGFGRPRKFKRDACTVEHDSKAEAWGCTCNTISADQWPSVEDGSRVYGNGFPVW